MLHDLFASFCLRYLKISYGSSSATFGCLEFACIIMLWQTFVMAILCRKDPGPLSSCILALLADVVFFALPNIFPCVPSVLEGNPNLDLYITRGLMRIKFTTIGYVF
jgi:hypothetical protein